MKYIQLKQALKDFTVFSLNDIKLIDPHFHRRRLNEWQEKEYIKKIAKGRYIFSDLAIDENVLFEIANRLYGPSYVSVESALSYYQIIPESVYGITSISTRRTYSFSTPLGEFQYRTLKPAFFFGYQIVKYNEKAFKIADIEKAVLDFFYLHPELSSINDIASLRFSEDIFRQNYNQKKLQNYLDKFGKKALANRIKVFLNMVINNK
jgi:predicted transcriptional regulator of viral defense system